MLSFALALQAAWFSPNPDAWTQWTPGAVEVLSLRDGPDTVAPPHRAPRRWALSDAGVYGDFHLRVEAQQTSREYGHRDLVVVFGYESPARFYYAHFATTPDATACNLFLVDGAPRRALAPVVAQGVDWGAAGDAAPWRVLEVAREGDHLRAWFDGRLVVEAHDATLGEGWVGVGSFDDTGNFRRFELRGAARSVARPELPRIERRAPLGELASWPQGPGPRGDFSADGPAPPLTFSAVTVENLRWRATLPATGQGGLAIADGRVFAATMAPWHLTGALSADEAERYRHATEGRTVVGKHIDAHAFDAATGAHLWTRRIEGEVPSIHSYPFSDATSASPVTDGTHVWFTNAGGAVACFTLAGELVWQRRFTPTFDGPFNKQFEPFLVQDGERTVFVHMEPRPSDEGQRWNHLVGLDAATGTPLWWSVDGLTHYNTPTLVTTEEGTFALIARGGPHDVPERPVGVSLVRLQGPRAGTSVWRFDDPRGNHEAALHVMARDGRYAYWILRDPESAVVALDLATGQVARTVSLTRGVARTTFDRATERWRTEPSIDLERGVFPARYTAHAAEGALFFQCYHTAFGAETLAPAHSFARIDVESGQVAYIEVPTGVAYSSAGVRRWQWDVARPARALDSRGEEVTGDPRSRWDGWDWVFNPAPTRIGGCLAFTLANGLVYLFDTRATRFDGEALLAVNDLGPPDAVWAASSCSYADGAWYCRTGAELLCFGWD